MLSIDTYFRGSMSISITHYSEYIDNQKVIRVIAPTDFSFIWYRKFRKLYKHEDKCGTQFIIDFINTQYLSTSALGMLFLLKDHLELIEGKLTFVNVRSKQPLLMFETTSNENLPCAINDEGFYKEHTSDMKKHGSYIINSQNQILIMKAYNSWNLETTISCCENFKVEANKIKHKEWSCLVDLSEWDLGPIEMLNEIKKLNIWSEKNNQKFEAVIVKNALQQHVLEKSQIVFTDVKTEFFDNHKKALDWLTVLQASA